MAKKVKPLASFFGALSKESANALERDIVESRKRHRIQHERKVKSDFRQLLVLFLTISGIVKFSSKTDEKFINRIFT